MYVVLAIHLLLCCSVILFLVPGKPLNLEGVLVSPWLQWVYGAFTLLNIPVIVGAGVGVLYVFETHIDVYAYILLISLVIDAIYFLVFLVYGRGCTTKTVAAAHHNHFVATLSCGVHDGFTLVCLTVLVLFKAVGVVVTNKVKAYIRSVYYDTFLPHMQKHLATLKYQQPEENEYENEYNDFSDQLPRMGVDLPTMPASFGEKLSKSMPGSSGWLKTMAPNAFPTMLPSMRSYGTAFPNQAYPSVGTLQPSMGPAMAAPRAAPISPRGTAVPSTIAVNW